MVDVYQNCPNLNSNSFVLRLLNFEDANDLLKVYSDPNAVPLFNSDNCHGDRFYYETLDRMKEAIHFWLAEYEKKQYVRWCIIQKDKMEVIGTMELFHRSSEDYFNHCGLLRLDLKSGYERESEIAEILSVMIPNAWEWFDCKMIATKAVLRGTERRRALKKLGFHKTEKELIGFDGTKYNDYFILSKT